MVPASAILVLSVITVRVEMKNQYYVHQELRMPCTVKHIVEFVQLDNTASNPVLYTAKHVQLVVTVLTDTNHRNLVRQDLTVWKDKLKEHHAQLVIKQH